MANANIETWNTHMLLREHIPRMKLVLQLCNLCDTIPPIRRSVERLKKGILDTNELDQDCEIK